MVAASALRSEAYAAAVRVLQDLDLPPHTALAATGSLARQEMTPYSDIDVILIVSQDHEPDPSLVEDLWYPVWDAKYRLDFALRTPQECAEIALQDASAGFAQLDLTYIAGEKVLVDDARQRLLSAWRRQLQRGFDSFVDIAIARWNRSGAVATMTNPDLKNGRGGLRDIQLLRALALGNLCDLPALEEERRLLLDARTLLHVKARRHRDILDPDFAADIADELGFSSRYELTAALVIAATAIDDAVERSLATARGVLGSRGAGPAQGRDRVRRPLDVDVVADGAVISLARTPNYADPWLLTRVGAAAARTGYSVSAKTWRALQELPPPPERWSRAAVDDFFAILSSPSNTPRVIAELDRYGLWERLVPEWGHVRGLLPRERSHMHSVDYHLVATVTRCAEVRTSVARPDLLLLAALYHDLGKGHERPHEQVGAELVARQAARMRFNLADISRVQTVVAEHTSLARLAATMDPSSDAARDALLDACHYDQLTISLLATLSKADALSTGPGVWSTRTAQAQALIVARALEANKPRIVTRPLVRVPQEAYGVGLAVDWQEEVVTVTWSGANKAEFKRIFALISALGWTVVRANFVRGDAGDYQAEFVIRTVQKTLTEAAEPERFIQSYNSRTYTELPDIAGEPTTAAFNVGGILEIRTVERIGALGYLVESLPEFMWLRHEILGATMIVHVFFGASVSRAQVVGNVTRALARD
ncbi:[protein-PII] uridylyltransferase [Corynebacterium rhinophilum]|uniref:[protein-PII] uridylyltransferase n=1 Tax=Corynebacterium rhinophilum TaxID=3050197 RepID=UPI00254E5410|nr:MULTISPECIES: [protein-PII] uridylyltransferase [unclassified Corynebacterium]MDK8701385.1 [protein-PII] uridylyltransferase [Corynebacterium sp. MSK107]MDK8703666.1 [protein-PII] uridylyltransferase [Corynebacterium sp. MSK090]